MADALKISFQLTDTGSKGLEVRVSAPGGEMRGEASLPPDSLMDEISAADPATVPAALVEKTGRALYGALVSESVDELVIDTLNDGRKAKQPVQFELRFDADQWKLARFPWEMIQNAEGEFLVRDWLADLTRYITYPQPPPEFDQAMHGLPLFRVLADPPGLPPLTFGPISISPLEVLDEATFDNFQRKLLIDRPNIWGIEFDGHGALVKQCAHCNTLNGPSQTDCYSCEKSLNDAKAIGALAFEKGADVEWVPTELFGSMLYNSHIRLAMLIACETARVGDLTVFSGLAPNLLLAGVPAVIGMQFPVLDTFANKFANTFYEAFVKDYDLLAALRTARRANIRGAWYSPALYLRRRSEPSNAPTSQTRNIDTAVPAKVQAGTKFLVRLWLRRPETKPMTPARLRAELDIPADVKVRQSKGESEVTFAPIEGRKLRQGEVEIELFATRFEFKPEKMKLFVDEAHDAPPAIFVVEAAQAGKFPLGFRVLQDGGVIYTVTHEIEVVEQLAAGAIPPEVATNSAEVGVEGGGPKAVIPPIPKMEQPPQASPAPAPAPSAPSGGTFDPEPREEAPPSDDLEETSPREEAPPPSDDLDETTPHTGEQAEAPADNKPMKPGASVPPPPPPRQQAPSVDQTQSGKSGVQQHPAPSVGRSKGGLPLVVTVGGVVLAGVILMGLALGGYAILSPLSAPTPTATPTSIPTETSTPTDTPSPTIEVTPTITATPDLQPPPPPQILAPTGRFTVKSCPTSMDLEWTEVKDPSGISGYEFDLGYLNANREWQTQEEGRFVTEPGMTLTLDCTINQATTYRWRVRAVDKLGNKSEWSPGPDTYATFTLYWPDTSPPPTPVAVSPVDEQVLGCNALVRMTWKPVEDPSGVTYRVSVYYQIDSPAWSFLTAVDQLKQEFYDLKIDPDFAYRLYRWQVEAIDGAGNTSKPSSFEEFYPCGPS